MVHSWLWEQFQERADYTRKSMFGCQAIYLRGRLMFCVAARHEPWNGVLIATEREHHPSLVNEFPFLVPHPILGKWLYLSQSDDAFEYRAESLMAAIHGGDARFGVVPKERASRRTGGHRRHS